MAGTLINTLYPPQISTFMPAFVNTEDAIVYFTLSPFNASSDIKRVHVTLMNQLNNENALKNVSGILMQPLTLDTKSGMYYVKIPTTALKGTNSFNINQFYKVQLRFDCYDGPDPIPTEEVELNYYYLSHQTSFSEWSTICLIRPILRPSIYLRNFENNETGHSLSFNRGIIPISGRTIFGGDISSVETETMQSYIISVLNESGTETIYQTPEVYTGSNIDPNVINYKLDLQTITVETSSKFKLRIDVVTKNQYKFHKDYDFQISNYIDDDNFTQYTTHEVEVDNENGIAKLKIRNDVGITGTLYVKRSSSVSNFQNWEPISITKVNGPINMTIEDNTVGSLIWYRYSLQLENSAGAFTQLIRTPKFLPKFYDAIFSRGSQQLAVRYDFKISNFKPVVNRAKIDTLGSRYPKFAENAVLNYKQFSISGYISSEADYNQLFLNKQKFFDDDFVNYRAYLSQEKIPSMVRNDSTAIGEELETHHVTTTVDDWMWEREFREEAVKWLNDGEPKLYRSMTEGVMPVMLTDISLTPNATLGRRIYQFSATAYEIADGHSLNTLESLGLIDIPKVDSSGSGSGGGSTPGEDDSTEVIKLGQIYEEKISNEKKNIIASIIGPRIKEKYAGILADKQPDGFYLKSIRIQFLSKPNIFKTDGSGNLLLITDPSKEDPSRLLLGYTFDLSTDIGGSQKIFVNSRGYYQIPDNLNVTELSFPQTEDVVNIDYVVIYKQKASAHSIISGSTVEKTVVGQDSGVYDYDEYLGDKIRAKYSFVKTDQYYEKMQYWRGICIDTEPYAIAHIKYRGDTDYGDYVVGETGVLHMLKDFPVIDMCFRGRRMFAVAPNRADFLEPWEYVNLGLSYDTTKLVENPKRNCVYDIGGEDKIYYKNKWYTFKENGDGTGNAQVPIEAMINYLGDIIKIDV